MRPALFYFLQKPNQQPANQLYCKNTSEQQHNTTSQSFHFILNLSRMNIASRSSSQQSKLVDRVFHFQDFHYSCDVDISIGRLEGLWCSRVILMVLELRFCGNMYNGGRVQQSGKGLMWRYMWIGSLGGLWVGGILVLKDKGFWQYG